MSKILCMTLYNERIKENSFDSISKELYDPKDYEAWSWIVLWCLQVECVIGYIWVLIWSLGPLAWSRFKLKENPYFDLKK